LRLAIDSFPLKNSIFDSFDHSGLQLYGLEHTPLHRRLKAVRRPNTTSWALYEIEIEPATWDDGSDIRPNDYVTGLRKLLAANPWLGKTAFRGLKQCSASRHTLRFEFQSDIPQFQELLELPNWVPFQEGKLSGNYRLSLDSNKKGSWSITDTNSNKSGTVTVVHSPRENWQRYAEGELDFTADTALDLNEHGAHAIKSDSGLFAQIVFALHLPDWLQTFLSTALTAVRFPEEIERHWQRLDQDTHSTERPLAPPSACPPLVLAYDDFYPNAIICAAIQTCLAELFQIEVKILKDNYYKPTLRPWDMKFAIHRALANTSLFRAYGLLSYPRSPLQKSPIASVIKSIENGQMEFSYSQIRKLMLGHALFQIPSLYYGPSTNHPLLRVLS